MARKNEQVIPYSLLTEEDVYLFREGKHFGLFEKLGAHERTLEGVKGTYFATWAPNAERVSVIGDFNGWNKTSHPLLVRWDSSGIWEGFIPGVQEGAIYKYSIKSKHLGLELEKGDPFAIQWEVPPRTASVVANLDYKWNEGNWPTLREKKNALNAPTSIYEIHLGSWKRGGSGSSSLTYLEMAKILPSYLKEMGFTHVQFMPVMEHPFYGSWGYQKTGYFAVSSRYGKPQDFMHLVDILHQMEIGVFLDWVPSHFPTDLHGLSRFDGTHLFEHADEKQGLHPEWNSHIFNYGRLEVRSFLVSSAIFWLKKYHVDGLRVDAVSSMLYLDYARKEGEWVPNIHGGKENLEATSFLKELNTYVYQKFPYVQMIAEESTAWPMVSRPVDVGGLSFGLKWNMGWMHDTLHYFSKDPIYRKFHHNELLFSLLYAYNENFVLSISHDEVVHGKGSLLNKMPGDEWQKFANLRLLFSYMFTHPGKKLLFMGSEIGQWNEWNHEHSLDWHLLEHLRHQGIQKILKDLNHLYRHESALHLLDFDPKGFEWVDLHNGEESVICYLRKGAKKGEEILVACNFTPIPRHGYTVGVPHGGAWREIFNSDSAFYGGSNVGNQGEIKAHKEGSGHYPYQLKLSVPPLGAVLFKQAS